MTWKSLLEKRHVVRHKTEKAEIDEIRIAIRRNLKDASVKSLSLENRFSIAYQAAYLSAKIAVFCAGYRLKVRYAHSAAFPTLKLALGASLGRKSLIDYLERCGHVREEATYHPGRVGKADVEELCKQAKALFRNVEGWIAKRHPRMA